MRDASALFALIASRSTSVQFIPKIHILYILSAM